MCKNKYVEVAWSNGDRRVKKEYVSENDYLYSKFLPRGIAREDRRGLKVWPQKDTVRVSSS